MDKRQILDNLKKKFDEISEEYQKVRSDIVYFENEPEYEEYNSYTEDAVKKEMFPKEYEAYQKLAELDAKLEPFEKELVNAARNLTKELNESIESLEKKVAVNEKYLKEAEEKIKGLEKQIDDLMATEAYKNGDEETVIQYNNLMSDLASETSKKNSLESRIKEINLELGKVKAEKEELIETYGEGVDKPAEEIDGEEPGEGKDNTGSADDLNKKSNESKDKNKDNSSKGVPGVQLGGNDVPSELSAEEKAKKEQEEKDKKLKEDFADLSAKAKKGKLTDKELDNLVEIMKDKENYDKLGLSMGLFFNKPRGIFKVLNKKYKDDESKLASINEAYSVYEEKFYEKHGEEKLKKLSKFFSIDEVEHKEATPALPANSGAKVEKTNNSLGDDLAGKTVTDDEYVDISSNSEVKTKSEHTKETI